MNFIALEGKMLDEQGKPLEKYRTYHLRENKGVRTLTPDPAMANQLGFMPAGADWFQVRRGERWSVRPGVGFLIVTDRIPAPYSAEIDDE